MTVGCPSQRKIILGTLEKLSGTGCFKGAMITRRKLLLTWSIFPYVFLPLLFFFVFSYVYIYVFVNFWFLFCFSFRFPYCSRGFYRKEKGKTKMNAVKMSAKKFENENLGLTRNPWAPGLTLYLPWLTKRDFILTISIQYQADKWWE